MTTDHFERRKVWYTFLWTGKKWPNSHQKWIRRSQISLKSRKSRFWGFSRAHHFSNFSFRTTKMLSKSGPSRSWTFGIPYFARAEKNLQIEVIQQEYERENWAKFSRSENQLRLTLENSGKVKKIDYCFVAQFLFSHLANWNGRLYSKVEQHGGTTVKLRIDLVQQCVKTPQNPFFWRFWAQNINFFRVICLFLSAHLVELNRRLSCEFEHHRSHTVKFRSFLVQTWLPQKNQFFDGF